LDIIDDLVKPELTNPLFKYVWSNFALNKGKTIILSKTDEELKEKMRISYDKMKDIFNDIDTATIVKESRKLNEGPQQEFIEQINKEVLDMIP